MPAAVTVAEQRDRDRETRLNRRAGAARLSWAREVVLVRVGGWSRPWNVKSDRSVGDAPGSPFWATDPNGFGQVGCVYTAQGFEYEWSGVIIGPDLVARNGRLVTDRAEFKDPNFRSRRTVSDAEADRLIRNTYKVLMTRGMRGTVLYAADAETRVFLTDLVRVRRGLETVYR